MREVMTQFGIALATVALLIASVVFAGAVLLALNVWLFHIPLSTR